MENNENIPNVSSVFRQLIQLSHTNPRFNSHQENAYQHKQYNNYAYQTHSNNQAIDFVSNMGSDDRQKRHEQLMGKLKSSLEQNKNIFSLNQSPMRKESSSYGTMNYSIQNHHRTNQNSYLNYTNNYDPPYNHPPYNHPPYNANQFSRTSQPANDKQRQWAAPRMKYRHIEDFKQESFSNENQKREQFQDNHKMYSNRINKNDYKNDLPDYLEKQIKIKQDLYESKVLLKSNMQNQENNYTHQKKQATDTHQEQIQNIQTHEEQENYNKVSRQSKKPSKYGQNLQSYYDICRKPIKPSSVIQKESNKATLNASSDKFLRKQVPRVAGINLQKAMRILSLDD